MIRAAWMDEVERALQTWRQGDCVLAEQLLVYRFDRARPVSPAAAGTAVPDDGGEPDIAADDVAGMAVLSQTCDLRRRVDERPFVEVAALTRVEHGDMALVQKSLRPRYAFVAGIASQDLVVDLDRTMIVEKPLVAGWQRVPGLENIEDERRFKAALARKHTRPAFPDDVASLFAMLRDRLRDKGRKNSPEGVAWQSLREIRVRLPLPRDGQDDDLMLFFIRERGTYDLGPDEGSWPDVIERWLEPLRRKGARVSGVASTLDDLTASDYVHSDPLDLDHLTP